MDWTNQLLLMSLLGSLFVAFALELSLAGNKAPLMASGWFISVWFLYGFF